MIFTTKNKEFAIFGNTITDVKEKWKEFKKELAENNGKLFGENGALASLFSGKKLNNILTPETLKQFDEFKEKFNSSSLSAEALAEQMKNVDQRIIDYAKTCKNGEMTTEGFKKSVEGMTLSAKAGQIALEGLRIAGSMIAMWAISKGLELAVKGIDNLIHSAEHCKERVDELMSSYQSAIDKANSNAKTIEELALRYEELSKGVDRLGRNVSLSTDEYAEYNKIVNQIADMFPTMIQGYTNEGNAILSLKGNVEELRDAYKEAQQEAYNMLIASGQDSDGNDIIKNWEDLHSTDFFSKLFDIGGAEVGGDISVNEALAQLKALSEMSAETYRNIEKVTGSGSREQIAALSEVEKLIGYGSYIPTTLGIDMSVSDKDFESARKQAKVLVQTYQAEIDSALKNVQTLANAYLMTNEDYAKLDDQSKNAASIIVNSINEGIASGFKDKVDVGEYVAKIVDVIKGNPEVQDTLVSLFSLDLSDIPVNEAKELIDLYIRSIAEAIGENELELRVRLGFDDTAYIVERLRNSIRQITDDHGMQNREEYAYLMGEVDFDSFTQAQAELWLEATLGAENAADAVQKWKDALESEGDMDDPASIFTDSLDKFQSSVKSAAEAYTTLLSGNYSSTDLLDSIQAINKAASEMGKSLNWEEIGSLDELSDKIEEISKAYADSVLSGTGLEDSKFCQMLANIVQEAYRSEAQLSSLNTQIDSLQSAYDSLTDIVETYNETGYVTFDQLQTLLAMEPQYLSCLIDENGHLRLNQEAMKELANQRLNEARAQVIQQTITELNELCYQNEEAAIRGTQSALEDNEGALKTYEEELLRTMGSVSLLTDEFIGLSNAMGNAIDNGASDEKIDEKIQNMKKKLQLINDTARNAMSDPSNFDNVMGKSEKKDKKTEKEFNWVEKLINRGSSALSKLKDKVSNTYIGWSVRNSSLTKAMEKTNDAIAVQQQAYERYMKEAESVGVSQEYINRIQNGTLDIEKITDETLSKQISAYTEW